MSQAKMRKSNMKDPGRRVSKITNLKHREEILEGKEKWKSLVGIAGNKRNRNNRRARINNRTSLACSKRKVKSIGIQMIMSKIKIKDRSHPKVIRERKEKVHFKIKIIQRENQIVGRKLQRSAAITKSNQPRQAAEAVWKKTLILKMTKSE